MLSHILITTSFCSFFRRLFATLFCCEASEMFYGHFTWLSIDVGMNREGLHFHIWLNFSFNSVLIWNLWCMYWCQIIEQNIKSGLAALDQYFHSFLHPHRCRSVCLRLSILHGSVFLYKHLDCHARAQNVPGDFELFWNENSRIDLHYTYLQFKRCIENNLSSKPTAQHDTILCTIKVAVHLHLDELLFLCVSMHTVCYFPEPLSAY